MLRSMCSKWILVALASALKTTGDTCTAGLCPEEASGARSSSLVETPGPSEEEQVSLEDDEYPPPEPPPEPSETEVRHLQQEATELKAEASGNSTTSGSKTWYLVLQSGYLLQGGECCREKFTSYIGEAKSGETWKFWLLGSKNGGWADQCIGPYTAPPKGTDEFLVTAGEVDRNTFNAWKPYAGGVPLRMVWVDHLDESHKVPDPSAAREDSQSAPKTPCTTGRMFK